MNLDIERERREFEAWYFDSGESGFNANRRDAEEGVHAAFKDMSFATWLAAKRAVVGSAEPVAWLYDCVGAKHLQLHRDDHFYSLDNGKSYVVGQPLILMSGDTRRDPVIAVVKDGEITHMRASEAIAFTAPPAPVSAEPVDMEDTCRAEWKELTHNARKDIHYPDFRAIWLQGRDFGISENSPPATDAKDSERWKEIAEYQLAMRVYPEMPGLAIGSLDAMFNHGWRWPGRQADIDAAIAAKEKAQ